MAQDFTKKALQYNRGRNPSGYRRIPLVVRSRYYSRTRRNSDFYRQTLPVVLYNWLLPRQKHIRGKGTPRPHHTPANKRPQAVAIFQLLVSDPSRPILSSYIVEHEMDLWDGFKILTIPDSLRTQLDAYIKKPSRESGVLKKKEYGLEIEGPYTSGKKHGHFVERDSYGIVFEGEYVGRTRDTEGGSGADQTGQ